MKRSSDVLWTSTGVLGTAGGITAAVMQYVDYFHFSETYEWRIWTTIIVAISSGIFALVKLKYCHSHECNAEVTFSIFDNVLAYMPLLAAKEIGLFKKRGIDVNIICSHGDKETWDDVNDGRAEFGLSDPVVMLKNGAKNASLLGTIVNKATLWGITRNKELPYFHSIDDIPEGLSISGYSEPTTTYQVLDFLRRKRKAKIITFKSGSESKAAENLETDIILLPEPFAVEQLYRNKEFTKVIDGPLLWGDIAWSGFYCLKSYIKGNEKTIQLVVDAIREALSLITNDSIKAQELAYEYISGT